MLKSISNLGTVLNKKEQKVINGGQRDCPNGQILVCIWSGCWCQAEIDDRPVEFAK